MWIPESAEQVEAAAASGVLVETPSFDGKLALPTPKKNADLAVDVAAMSTDGGVLLYGVGEDQDERLTVLRPIELAGAADRIGQIVSTSISEVPYIDPRELPSADDPSVGYLVIVVPQSARAPHQVTVGGDLRYYGRGAKGNRRLNEGEVARLYQRRQAWEVDREEILQEVVSCAPFAPDVEPGHVHAFARPLAPDQTMFERAIDAFGGPQAVQQRMLAIVDSTTLRGSFGPNLEQASYWERRGADEWRLSTSGGSDRDDSNPRFVDSIVDLNINVDGRGQLFCGRATAGASREADSESLIMEVVIAGNIEAFFAVMGEVYRAAGYVGHVDIGVVLTGLQGAGSHWRSRDWGRGSFRYSADTFTRTARLAAAELGHPAVVAHSLLRNLYEATTGEAGYSPFPATDPQ